MQFSIFKKMQIDYIHLKFFVSLSKIHCITDKIQIPTYSQPSPCGHPVITDKIQITIYRALTKNDSRYYGLSLFRTQNGVLQVFAITRVGCIFENETKKLKVNVIDLHFHENNEKHCLLLGLLVSDKSPRI